jgi:hypothetical protein
MAPRWPQVNNGPEHINEHATYLKEACNQLQAADRGRKNQVPWNIVQPYLTSTVALIGKILRQPAIGEILQHVQDAAKCTQNIQRDVSIIKNSVGLSTTPVNIANFSSNRGANASWAQVAAQAKGSPPIPPPASSNTSTKAQATVTAYQDRAVTVKLKDHGIAQRFRTQSAAWIKQQVETSVHNITATKSIQIIAAHQLKSGDVQIFTSTTTEATQLKQNTEWLAGLGERAELITPTFGVIVHGIATNSINVKDQKASIQQMLADNHTVIPHAQIAYVGWLTKEATLKRASSIVVEFKDPEMANAVIYAGMAWNGHIHQCQLYDRACRIKQCFRCYNYGHIGTQCSASQFCGYCAERHEIKHCKQKGVEGFTPRCVVCKDAHTAWSNACPARKKELGRVEEAKQARSIYWHVPAKEIATRPRTRNTHSNYNRPTIPTAVNTALEQTANQEPEEPTAGMEQRTVTITTTDNTTPLGEQSGQIRTARETETRIEPPEAPIPTVVPPEEEWTTPATHTDLIQQPNLLIDPQLLAEEHPQPAYSTQGSEEQRTAQYPLDGLEGTSAQQEADAWLQAFTDNLDGEWNREQTTATISPPVSTATDPHTAQGTIYKGCRCPAHQNLYNDWPTHDAELTITSCMRTCMYCGKDSTTAPNLRRHLRNVEYTQRNISIRQEKKGRSISTTPSWTATQPGASSTLEQDTRPPASAPETRRTRNQFHTDSINVIPSSC